jgi:F-type H+-transporting ATPase subunit gamma
MANARALDKRRKSVRNIRKITRTMELIATARFKKAMDRAVAATAYTTRITEVVRDLANAGLEFSHPLLDEHSEPSRVTLLVLTANRGLCGGYNGAVQRIALAHRDTLQESYQDVQIDVSGKRGIGGFGYRNIEIRNSYTQFDDKPSFDEIEPIANAFMEAYAAGEVDRLDVAYTKFLSSARQAAVVETLLPLGSLSRDDQQEEEAGVASTMYDFLPSAESILEEVVPASFRVKLFKCFLDAAVSEQIARMVAMKAATENASDMIKQLSRTYNRARQSQITNEIMEIIGGVEALSN